MSSKEKQSSRKRTKSIRHIGVAIPLAKSSRNHLALNDRRYYHLLEEFGEVWLKSKRSARSSTDRRQSRTSAAQDLLGRPSYLTSKLSESNSRGCAPDIRPEASDPALNTSTLQGACTTISQATLGRREHVVPSHLSRRRRYPLHHLANVGRLVFLLKEDVPRFHGRLIDGP